MFFFGNFVIKYIAFIIPNVLYIFFYHHYCDEIILIWSLRMNEKKINKLFESYLSEDRLCCAHWEDEERIIVFSGRRRRKDRKKNVVCCMWDKCSTFEIFEKGGEGDKQMIQESNRKKKQR